MSDLRGQLLNAYVEAAEALARIGDALLAARRIRGHSLTQVERLTGISRVYLNLIERAQRLATVEEIEHIAHYIEQMMST